MNWFLFGFSFSPLALNHSFIQWSWFDICKKVWTIYLYYKKLLMYQRAESHPYTLCRARPVAQGQARSQTVPTVHRAYCPSSHPISADTITTVCASEQQPEEIYDCYRWRRFVAHILCPASCNENTINTVITPLILVYFQVFSQFSHSKNEHAFLWLGVFILIV